MSGHLTHDGPPQGAKRRPWSLRATDFDPLGHVNNAAVWEPVEEEMTRTASAGRLCRAELEFRAPIPPGVRMEVVRAAAAGRTDLWLVDDGDGTVHVSARLLVAPDR